MAEKFKTINLQRAGLLGSDGSRPPLIIYRPNLGYQLL